MSTDIEKPVTNDPEDGLFKNNTSSQSSFKKDLMPDNSSHLSESERADGEHGNILSQYTEKQVMVMGRNYAIKYGLDPDLFAKGAALARAPNAFNSMPFLTDEEKQGLYLEQTKKWHIPSRLWAVVAAGAMAAAVQGMDESVINGATLFYPKAFRLQEHFPKNYDLVEGLINGAPYLMCSVFACWTTDLWNRYLGRKWTIFWTCAISAVTCIWSAVTNNWYHLFIARLFLGIGIGVKSATVPIYSAECSPKQIRGSLCMLWQLFTAVGIMFGYVASLAFYYVPKKSFGTGLNWRLMLGSACIPAFIVLFQIPFIPESPRWLMGKGRHQEAFDSLAQLRYEKVAVARDLFYQFVLLQEEGSVNIPVWKKVIQMFTIRRNRNAAIGSWIVMFMQQFCGINVIAYYSSTIFINAGLGEVKAMVFGFGLVNSVFALPAFYTIDTFGRRNLLLFAFPLMCIFLLITGFGFLIKHNQKGQLAMVATGIYIFTVVYSTSEGPVPFPYAAEAFPLYIRDIGTSFATATCWFFNFILAFTFPRLLRAFTSCGAFCFYAAWNLVGWFLVLWFVPETKQLTLEELDDVFAVPMYTHAVYRTRTFLRGIQQHVFRRKNLPEIPPIYTHQRMAVTNPSWNEKTEVDHIE
ncbi:hypothetical protein KGF54_002489 [Candida jiufengensis]|uniref:uncharacterized protein n=1 Tax=Candida jiufengensis TaxID=497108 RepID=UPI0022251390|nr:uncharacterized protein KGF54_002489 [Candida jiufengensis]KAI5953118.1 hypothetical protein KGF54_002489 [Candida jiufengensis]